MWWVCGGEGNAFTASLPRPHQHSTYNLSAFSPPFARL
jgi:hypothetical protein